MKRDIASLWIGSELGEIELASLHSFHRLGHRFVLYAYSEIRNVPSFVELRDAAEIFPTKKILRHKKTGSPALHSDLFRYALMAKTDLVWCDLDVIALREFDFVGDFVFAHEHTHTVGCSVLRLPKNSRALMALLSVKPETKGMPPHLRGFRRAKYRLRSTLTGGIPIEKWPWGAIGPSLLTEALRTTGEISAALPVNAFYSVPMSGAWRFCEPGGYSRGDAPDEAYAVHLWAQKLRQYVNDKYDGQFPEGSFVRQELGEHALR